MKLIFLFVGLCVSVGVLCSVPDQVEAGLTISSRSGDMLAPSYNRTLIRDKRYLPLVFGVLIAVGAVTIAAESSKLDNISYKRGVPPSGPIIPESLVSVNRLVNSFYKQFIDKNELCSPKLNRRKREPNSNCYLPVLAAAGINYYNTIEQIAAALRDRPDVITTDVSNDNRHAVLDYTTITAPANQDHAQPIDLTVTIRGNLTYDNTAQTLRASAINPAITRRMQEMDWYREGNRETNDERGHLLADSLGGPSFPWNFVPQSPSVNRGVSIRDDSDVTFCWFDLEAEIRQLLQENQDHHIIWTIVVAYGGLPTWRRPTGFMISVRLMAPDNVFVNSRMFFIPNLPSDACTNTNHRYWHLQ